MPVQPTYPGVYIQEIPSGVRTIVGVSTSIGAFIDYFKRGPLNKAVQIFNFGDFERIFGGLDSKSEASYAIQQFFLNGGSQAFVVRVAGAGAAKAEVRINDAANNLVLVLEAASPGKWGEQLRAVVDHKTPVAGEFNLTISEIDGAGSVLRQELFLNLSMAAGKTNVKTIINDPNSGSALVRVKGTPGATRPALNGTQSAVVGTSVNFAAAPGDQNLIVSVGGVDLPVKAKFNIVKGTYTIESIASLLENAIRACDRNNPIIAGMKVQVVGDKLNLVGGPGGAARIITLKKAGVNTDLIDALKFSSGTTDNVQAYALGQTVAAGAQAGGVLGNDGAAPGELDLIGQQNTKTGLYALEDVDLFNILCIPATAAVDDSSMDALFSAAISYCEARRAFFIIDPPKTNLDAFKTWHASKASLIRSKNTALHFPRVMTADPLDNFRLRSVGASGTLAGLYARTDSNRGVWKSPAGTEATLRNVSKLEYTLTDAENGVLNPLGINCLRNFPVYGNVSWGARTLEGADAMASEWKYLAVRRLTLFLEESLFRGSQWVVFEPNDEALWAQIRLSIGAFMNNLFKQGAFQGTSPRDAYLVKCDAETTTQNDINLGIVNIVVGLAPLKPAEFVIINIKQLAGQIQV